jgi:UDP-glucose 4-epimerase
MHCVVTGGAGFIGSHLVDRLLKDGHDVVVIDNESSDAHKHPYWNSNADNHKQDINDYETLKELTIGADVIFHLAAESRIQPTIENPRLAIQTNTLGTCNVLQAAKENGIKRVVYSSTSAAYGFNDIPEHRRHTKQLPKSILSL